MSNNYLDGTQEWLKNIHINGSVVDIGGGKKEARDRLGSCIGEYKVLDRKFYNGLEFNPDIVHDMNYPIETTDQFDYAFYLYVIEFVFNPIIGFQNINKLLKKDGILYFNAPFKMPHLVVEDYYRFTDTGLKKLLEETGFKLLSMDFKQGEYDYYLVKAQKIWTSKN